MYRGWQNEQHETERERERHTRCTLPLCIYVRPIRLRDVYTQLRSSCHSHSLSLCSVLCTLFNPFKLISKSNFFSTTIKFLISQKFWVYIFQERCIVFDDWEKKFVWKVEQCSLSVEKVLCYNVEGDKLIPEREREQIINTKILFKVLYEKKILSYCILV